MSLSLLISRSKATHLPVATVSVASHKFWYAVLFLVFQLKLWFLISPLVFFLTQNYVQFCCLFFKYLWIFWVLVLISNKILLFSEILYNFSYMKFIETFYWQSCSVSLLPLHMHLKNMYPSAFCCNAL